MLHRKLVISWFLILISFKAFGFEGVDNCNECHSIEGPFNRGEPIHETLSSIALNKFDSSIPENYKKFDASSYEYIRGVIWNDDPLASFFDTDTDSNSNWSSGLGWLTDFCGGARLSSNNLEISLTRSELIKRSHFGDMQFLHGMASQDDIDAERTQKKILNWFHFVFIIVNNDSITSSSRLKEIESQVVEDHFFMFKDMKLEELFGKKNYHQFDVKKRAIGTVLHLIQDSYAGGHIERDNGHDVISYLSYTRQDYEKHKIKDGWGVGVWEEWTKPNTMLARNIPNYSEIIIRSHDVLRLLANKSTTWEELQKYLLNNIYRPASKQLKSYSGVGMQSNKVEIPGICKVVPNEHNNKIRRNSLPPNR